MLHILEIGDLAPCHTVPLQFVGWRICGQAKLKLGSATDTRYYNHRHIASAWIPPVLGRKSFASWNYYRDNSSYLEEWLPHEFSFRHVNTIKEHRTSQEIQAILPSHLLSIFPHIQYTGQETISVVLQFDQFDVSKHPLDGETLQIYAPLPEKVRPLRRANISSFCPVTGVGILQLQFATGVNAPVGLCLRCSVLQAV